MDDAREGADACAGPRREAYSEPGVGADGAEDARTARRSVQDPGVQPGPVAAALGAAAGMLWRTWGEALVERDEGGWSVLGTWDLHAQVVSRLAAELCWLVTSVADADLAQQARGRLVQAGICPKPNAILKFSVDVARLCERSPCEVLAHSTER